MLPDPIRESLAERALEVLCVPTQRQARDPALLSGVDAVLLCSAHSEDGLATATGEQQLLADALITQRLTGIVLSPNTTETDSGAADALVFVSPDISVDELWGRLATVQHYRPLLARMDQQVAVMQRLGKKLNQQFVEVDQELRLASRLQRDFLPKKLPRVNDINFAAVYRPATWVSGDVYDVRRLDESHVGFLVADAVGHGVAAGLLTMFIKHSVVGKRIFDDGYTLVPPSEVLNVLNRDLANQDLPNCQFVTACYGIIDTRTNEIVFARGGHPHPIHVSADGHCAEIHTVGGLLGVFNDEAFPSARLILEPGEKLIIYSDGMEDIILDRDPAGTAPTMFTDAFQKLVRRPAEACASGLAAHLDHREGSLQPADDQTCIVIENAVNLT
ncbi:MAG: SpoIIE family protein phosphatase [Phycisphaerales bacterium]|nr:SpoIIE family protein phosphatase [Phycisphaerales bacterium]